MNPVFAMILTLYAATSNILPVLEQKLDAGFHEDTYRRYLYYCRQQNEGPRLVGHSTAWLERYPDQEILRFGEAEGLLMSGKTQEGIKKFRELYKDSYRWANEIIFILKELDSGELTWFVAEERKRTGNPTLHARFMVESYLEEGNERKALSEIADALAAGQNPHIFSESLNKLSQGMGSERVLAKLQDASPRAGFQLALELKDTGSMEKAIGEADDTRDLIMMGHLCEHNGYPEQALLAYERAGRKSDAARVLTFLGREDEALALLQGDNSPQGLQQRALLLSSSSQTYPEAIKTYRELQTRFGSRAEWNMRIATLYLLQGNERKANEYLRGLAPDSSLLLLKGIMAVLDGELDSLRQFLDRSMVSFACNAYENDLLLLYSIALTQSAGAKPYAEALAAYHWGDAGDAYHKSLKLAESNPELADEALLLAAENLVRLGRWQEAEATYLKLAENHPGSPLSPRAKFEQALLLRDHLDAPAKARHILAELIIREPTSLYADLARQEM